MSSALKSVLVPAIESVGFSGRFPRFRRNASDSVHFLAVFYDKEYRSCFLEFGSHPSGAKETSWGEIVPEEKLLIEHVPFTERARLQEQSGGGSITHQWFQFANFEGNAASYLSLAERIASLFPQVDAWLSSGIVGPNISHAER